MPWAGLHGTGMPPSVAVYDLGEANEYLNPIGLGTYHSGLVLHGKEWTFASQAGVFNHAPKGANAPFRQSVVLGTTQMSSSEVAALVNTMKPDWPGKSYHLVKRNCNSFASALAQQVLGKGKDIPGWVNRMADIGNMCSCLIPEDAGGAPVDGPGAAGGSASGFQTIAPRRPVGGSSVARPTPTFEGGGARLGSSTAAPAAASWGSSPAPAPADAAARRERARAAALARMAR